jgi:acetyl esterase/lipase
MANHVSTFSQEAAGADDGYGSRDGTFTTWSDTTTINVGQHSYAPYAPIATFRIKITGVPQGSTINSAYLHVKAYTGTNFANSSICVENSLSPAQFSATAGNKPADRINVTGGYTLCTTNGTARYLANVWTQVTAGQHVSAGAINNASVPDNTELLSVNFASLLQPLVTNASWNETAQYVVVAVAGGTATPVTAQIYGKSHASAINHVELNWDDPTSAAVRMDPTPLTVSASIKPPIYGGTYTATVDYGPGRYADIYIPIDKPKPPGGYPVAVFVHGGRFVTGYKNASPNDQNSMPSNWKDGLLANGVAVISVEYALSGLGGADVYQSDFLGNVGYNTGTTHPVGVKDVKTATKYFQDRGDATDGGDGTYPINSTKFIAAGHSAGTHIALSAALTVGDTTEYIGYQNDAYAGHNWQGYAQAGGRNNWGFDSGTTYGLTFKFNYRPWGGATTPNWAKTTATDCKPFAGAYLYAPVVDLTQAHINGIYGAYTCIVTYMGRCFANGVGGTTGHAPFSPVDEVRGEGDLNRYIDPTILVGASHDTIYKTARGSTKRIPNFPIAVHWVTDDEIVNADIGVNALYNVLSSNGVECKAPRVMSAPSTPALSPSGVSLTGLTRIQGPTGDTGGPTSSQHGNVAFNSSIADFITWLQPIMGANPLVAPSVDLAAGVTIPEPTITSQIQVLTNIGTPIHVDATLGADLHATVGDYRVAASPFQSGVTIPDPKIGPSVRPTVLTAGTTIPAPNIYLWWGNTTGATNGANVAAPAATHNFSRIYKGGLGAQMTYSTDYFVEGTNSIKHLATQGSETNNVQITGLTLPDILYMRFYFKITAWPTGDYGHCLAALDSTQENDAGGKLRLAIGKSPTTGWNIGGYGTRESVVAGSWAIDMNAGYVPGEWYAVQWKVDKSTSTWTQMVKVTRVATNTVIAQDTGPRTITGTSSWSLTGARWGLVINTPAATTFTAYTDGHALAGTEIPLLDPIGYITPYPLSTAASIPNPTPKGGTKHPADPFAATTTIPAPELRAPVLDVIHPAAPFTAVGSIPVTYGAQPPDADLIIENFNNGTDGASVTELTTMANSVLGIGTMTHSNAHYMTDTLSAYVNTTSYRYLNFILAGRPRTYISLYFRMPSLPTSSTIFVEVQTAGSTTAAQASFLSSGTFRIRNGTTQVGATYAIQLNQWYRMDWWLDGVANQMNARLYTGTTLHSPVTTDAVFTTGTVAYGQGTMGDIWFGSMIAVTAPGWQFYMDRFMVDSDVMPSPLQRSMVSPTPLAATADTSLAATPKGGTRLVPTVLATSADFSLTPTARGGGLVALGTSLAAGWRVNLAASTIGSSRTSDAPFTVSPIFPIQTIPKGSYIKALGSYPTAPTTIPNPTLTGQVVNVRHPATALAASASFSLEPTPKGSGRAPLVRQLLTSEDFGVLSNGAVPATTNGAGSLDPVTLTDLNDTTPGTFQNAQVWNGTWRVDVGGVLGSGLSIAGISNLGIQPGAVEWIHGGYTDVDLLNPPVTNSERITKVIIGDANLMGPTFSQVLLSEGGIKTRLRIGFGTWAYQEVILSGQLEAGDKLALCWNGRNTWYATLNGEPVLAMDWATAYAQLSIDEAGNFTPFTQDDLIYLSMQLRQAPETTWTPRVRSFRMLDGPFVEVSSRTTIPDPAIRGSHIKAASSFAAATAIPAPTLTGGIVNVTHPASALNTSASTPGATAKGNGLVQPTALTSSASFTLTPALKGGGRVSLGTSLSAATSIPAPTLTGRVSWTSLLSGVDDAPVSVGDNANNFSDVWGTVVYDDDVTYSPAGNRSIWHGGG